MKACKEGFQGTQEVQHEGHGELPSAKEHLLLLRLPASRPLDLASTLPYPAATSSERPHIGVEQDLDLVVLYLDKADTRGQDLEGHLVELQVHQQRPVQHCAERRPLHHLSPQSLPPLQGATYACPCSCCVHSIWDSYFLVFDVLTRDGLVKGLCEVAKAIEKHAAQLCVLAEDCDQPDYVKLIKALCAEHNVHLVTVPSSKTLGEWAGVVGKEAHINHEYYWTGYRRIFPSQA